MNIKKFLSREDINRLMSFFSFIPDDIYLKLMYRIRMGKKLNLDNPQTFNEKIQWLKLYDRKDIYTKMVDKYEVKKYVAEKIGEEYIIPTLGVWDRFDDIDFDKLPERFVLKCTHDSGGLVICRDKKTLDLEKARKKIEQSLKTNFYWVGREWPYKNVKPRIIAEEYMEDSTRRNDYKEFNPLPKKPDHLDDMVKLANSLSQGLKFIRVDFYEVNNKVFFGELTFSPGGGFTPFSSENDDLRMGQLLEI